MSFGLYTFYKYSVAVINKYPFMYLYTNAFVYTPCLLLASIINKIIHCLNVKNSSQHEVCRP